MGFDGQDAFNSGADRAFPRFMSRGDGDAVTAAPPPLPEEPWPVRLQQVFAAWPPGAKYATVALVFAVPACVAVVAGQGSQTIEPRHVGHVIAARNEVADALRVVAEFEARLDYTGNFTNIAEDAGAASHLQTGEPQINDTSAIEQAADPVQTEAAVFHLPDSVTATAGGTVNEAAWTWAASDPVAIIMMPQDETPAPAGLTVGALHQYSGEQPQTIDETLAAPTIVVSQVTGAISEPVEAAPAAVPHKRHTRQSRSQERVAVEDGGRKKRVKRAKESVIAKTIVKTVPVQSTNGDDDVATETSEDKKPGVLTKLFSWLKGSNNQQQADDGVSDGKKAGLLRQH
jgi:hypothetical protein